MKIYRLIFTGATILLAASLSYAQSDTSSSPGTDAQTAQATGQSSEGVGTPPSSQKMTAAQLKHEETLNLLHHINQKEIQLGQMAQSQAQSQQVKNVAKKIVRDHQNADQQLQSIAQSENVTLQSFQPSDFEKVTMDNLKKMSGPEFDRAFLQQMRTGHHVAIQAAEAIRRTEKDAKIRSYVSSILPELHEHEALAMRAQRGMPSEMAGSMQGQTGQAQGG